MFKCIIQQMMANRQNSCVCRYLNLTNVLKTPRTYRSPSRKSIAESHDDELMADNFDDMNNELNVDNFDQLASEYLKEQHRGRQKIDYQIVKQKYFKENLPNFLYWQEREQIRYLHATNKEVWTVEKLSEAFPALPETIKKILKSTWNKIDDENKARKHNESVKANWAAFKSNRIQLPEDLKGHLRKFLDRKIDLDVNDQFKPSVKESLVEKLNIDPKRTRFLDIVANDKEKYGDQSNEKVYLEQPYLSDKMLKKTMTHEYFKSKVMHFDENEKNVSETESRDVDYEQNEVIRDLSGDANTIILRTEHKEEIGFRDNDYPDKITIPKKLFSKGKLYRVDDCYYDDDGEFLYRVLGMGIAINKQTE